ncbi:MAG TPA: YHS domain-containing protein [Gammaproteobacteria bacterium]|nr:YHS domain-containing protein [Gammaproteobacteria bacterium]
MDILLQLLLFGGLFFVMMKFGCGSHGASHGKHGEKGAQTTGGCCGGGGDKSKDKQESQPPAKDVDPVCGKTVATEQAKTSLHGGLVYFFCSSSCREKFEGQPSLYTSLENPPSPALLEARHATD